MSELSKLDASIIETLKEVLEDEFKVLIDTYVADSDERLASLQGLIDNNDADTIRHTAHSFKGSSSNLGAHHLAELCFALEEAGRTESLANASVQLQAIEAEYAEVKQELLSLI